MWCHDAYLLIFIWVTPNSCLIIITQNMEKIKFYGKLLEKAGIDIENVKLEVSFDLIIETALGYNFKSNVKLDLPTGNILQDGVSTKEDSELTNVIFKRF